MLVIHLLESSSIAEINMSPSNLKRMSSNIADMLVGMEFEMYVPNVDAGHFEPDYVPDYDYDGYINASNWEDLTNKIISFFTSSEWAAHTRGDITRILDRDVNQEFLDWLDREWDEYADDNFSDWWNRNHFGELEPKKGTSAYITALDKYRDDEFIDWTDSEDKISDWLDDENINSYRSFGERYDLYWPHLRDANNDFGDTQDLDEVASDFSKAVGMRVETSTEYHTRPKSNDAYMIEPDSSLVDKTENNDSGLEFVSPPLPLSNMLDQLDKVRRWAKKNGCYTNTSTGLHMNISMPGYSIEKLDYCKLALFLGDDWVSSQFNRLGNGYAASSLAKIGFNIYNADIQAVLKNMKAGLAFIASKLIHNSITDKYVTINTHDNRIEFRSPGGNWLDEDLTKLTNTLFRFAAAMKIALDPTKEQKEYAKKLYKVISEYAPHENLDTLKYFTLYSTGAITLGQLKGYISKVHNTKTRLQFGPEGLITYNIIRNPNEVAHEFQAKDLTQAENIMYKWLTSRGYNSALYRLDYA